MSGDFVSVMGITEDCDKGVGGAGGETGTLESKLDAIGRATPPEETLIPS